MQLSSKLQLYLALGLMFLVNVGYLVWSFSFTDPNLVFTNWPPFWAFQQMMWQLPKQNLTILYIVMIVILFICSFWLSRLAEKLHLGFKRWLLIFILVTSPLLFSNNALSHDVFNYIFNARMVVKYQMDPHVQVAQHFTYDPWIRFMHNIHTPAPYFYGWTALSLLPYLLGLEKFVLTWLLFRLWSELGLILSFVFVGLIMKKQGNTNMRAFVLLLFNPLLIVELISNSHNDGWLLWPALASMFLVMKKNGAEKLSAMKIVTSLGLLLFSMSTKYATALLIPVWVLMAINVEWTKKLSFNLFKIISSQFNLFDLSAILMFLPLLTARSQQFNPWYLSWCLFFYPVMKNKLLRMSLIILSISSLFRYIPWLWNGAFEYTSQIQLHGKLITWIPVLAFIVIYPLLSLVVRKTTSSR